MYDRGTKYLEKGNYLKALTYYKKCNKEFKELFINMGNCYKALGNNKAMECYLQAASDSVPSYAGVYGPYSLALNNIGLLEYASGNDTSALAFYSAALSLDPLYYEAIWNYGNALLRSSNCLDGWQHYEYRLKRNNPVKLPPIEMWDGKSAGDIILVLTEQGIGDKIMFGRYLSYLEKYFKEVVIMCHPSLNCIYPYKCVTSTEGYSLGIGICSLAKVFGIVPENWLDRRFNSAKYNGHFSIGVCWNGSVTHSNNRNRSCSSGYFSGLSNYGDLYSISPDANDARGVTRLDSKSWSETASYLLGLDLVVSVDTSIVHMAGTLGVPCIMVQPLKETDFRWGNGRDKNVWYKSVDIVPNNNNWDLAFAEVHKRIECIKK